MNLYLITQPAANGYDTYDSAVVVAESHEQATQVSPNQYYKFHDDRWYFQYEDGSEKPEDSRYDWAHPRDVTAAWIGIAIESLKAGTVICASFNAG